ncbi:HipA domain-containing protein [Mogibacterium timidum]|uniref:HipA-like C-terminal domain protein n=2 Tax=Mogibacterium timidum TaxID=35519 RepID=X8IV59_9FIRM|nr:HipA domain-containing protein [Mogibacterium timidum]EUC53079.1 HipA-like C-terminal domain protein [Mogibacterium timidum ATCC 33093]NWO22889.1 HipA domain-containing protein [Mogibacterium timidum]
MGVIDFTDLKKRKKIYAGANGNKISVIYEGEQYMLKFPPQAKLNKGMSYSNSCFSEYLGCQIYESIGIPVQKTLMGVYTVKGKQKIVVACGDFTEPGVSLQDFASLKNRMIDSERQGYGTELIDILQTIDEQTLVDRDSLLERFWDMFIVDAFIGNWDRHNGNWGFLYDDRTDEMTLAPVYDCGSCLYPQADKKIMEAVLSDPGERNHRIYNIPLSAIMQEGKKIKYFDYISSMQNEDCNRALKRIVPRIDMGKIKGIIDYTPFISDLQKDFYLTMLIERKKRILDFSIEKLDSK